MLDDFKIIVAALRQTLPSCLVREGLIDTRCLARSVNAQIVVALAVVVLVSLIFTRLLDTLIHLIFLNRVLAQTCAVFHAHVDIYE